MRLRTGGGGGEAERLRQRGRRPYRWWRPKPSFAVSILSIEDAKAPLGFRIWKVAWVSQLVPAMTRISKFNADACNNGKNHSFR